MKVSVLYISKQNENPALKIMLLYCYFLWNTKVEFFEDLPYNGLFIMKPSFKKRKEKKSTFVVCVLSQLSLTAFTLLPDARGHHHPLWGGEENQDAEKGTEEGS